MEDDTEWQDLDIDQTPYKKKKNKLRWTFYDYETSGCGHIKIAKLNRLTLCCDGGAENIAVYAMGIAPQALINLTSPSTSQERENILKLNFGKTDYNEDLILSDTYTAIYWDILNGPIAELNTIFVDDKMRRQGVATEVIKLTTLDIAKKGVKFIYGIMKGDDYCGISFEERKNFYKTAGFHFPTESEREIIGTGTDLAFVSRTDNPLLQNPKSARDDYLTDRIADILNDK